MYIRYCYYPWLRFACTKEQLTRGEFQYITCNFNALKLYCVVISKVL